MSFFNPETFREAGISTRERPHPELLAQRAANEAAAQAIHQEKIKELEESSTKHGVVYPEKARKAGEIAVEHVTQEMKIPVEVIPHEEQSPAEVHQIPVSPDQKLH